MIWRWQMLPDVRRDLNQLHGEMDRLFDRSGTTTARRAEGGVYPPLNVWEDENNLYFEAELPGLELGDLEIYVTGDNQLSVKGERKQPSMQNGTCHRQERSYGSFARLVELPANVDSDTVSAELRNGVLTVTLPKRAETKPRRIEVKTG